MKASRRAASICKQSEVQVGKSVKTSRAVAGRKGEPADGAGSQSYRGKGWLAGRTLSKQVHNVNEARLTHTHALYSRARAGA